MMTHNSLIAERLADRINSNFIEQNLSAEMVYDTLLDSAVDPATVSLEQVKQILAEARQATHPTFRHRNRETCGCGS